jgi:hypothetical protein
MFANLYNSGWEEERRRRTTRRKRLNIERWSLAVM